ncbi:TPA: hypothetical protein DIV48_03535 [Candidatus Kaiserbacteria bacterium]|nr:MAG: hypothetical protein UY93_C0002G0334 [Parcubacteria group bacterium GW2011_GWA1_56_13]KKW46234.1 MAG: hypothetical protein UY97_C0008G0021 [Parcubacteria group bacterium GW2011_GWB1_57_6]HCR52684.1 hypothetical protein [Candidatus Kaiserbacteria bacterium]
MPQTFFLKYENYRLGLRFTIDGSMFQFEHCVEPSATDEVFKNWNGLSAFQQRLLQLYGRSDGNEWLLRLTQHLLEVAEREYVTNSRRRAKKK